MVAMSRQSEYAERTNKMRKEELTRKKEKEDKKKDRMGDLHKTTLNMLVMASATDCDGTPSNTAESCRLFFNCKNATLADQELHQQFEDMGLGDIGFAHGTTQALYNVGQGKTLEDIKKSAKQSVRVPTDFSGLKTQLSYWMGACKIFFGDESVPVEKLEELNTMMIKYKHHFTAKTSMNEMFLAKI
eukprot:12337962-Ditylum_brightwellii.AAC.1